MIVHELLEYCNDEHSTNCYTEETMTTSHRYKQGTGIKTQDKISIFRQNHIQPTCSVPEEIYQYHWSLRTNGFYEELPC